MTKPIYPKLAPFTIEERIHLSLAAVHFFSPMNYQEVCRALGRQPESGRIVPFSAMDFVLYLGSTGQLPEATSHMQRIAELLAQLARAHILTEVGHGAMPLLGTNYYFWRQLTTREQQGRLWLGSALGPEFLAHVFAPFVIHVTGRDRQGNERGATALVIARGWLLTCAHVVNRMRVHPTQSHADARFTVKEILAHPDVDVALIHIEQASDVLGGLAFRDPVWAEPIVTFGYPRIPLSREPALLMHSGEISAPAVKTFSGHDLFLYSAIARPGNSGGPVVSLSGYVVGLVTEELSEQLSSGSVLAGTGVPFFAGVNASVIARAVADLTQAVTLPMEDYQ